MVKQTSHNKQHYNQGHRQAHINALNKSGLSRIDFCRQYNLSYQYHKILEQKVLNAR
jgi:hypothetical protein